MGLGQYNSLGEYCGSHTASSVFLISVSESSCVAGTIQAFSTFMVFFLFFNCHQGFPLVFLTKLYRLITKIRHIYTQITSVDADIILKMGGSRRGRIQTGRGWIQTGRGWILTGRGSLGIPMFVGRGGSSDPYFLEEKVPFKIAVLFVLFNI